MKKSLKKFSKLDVFRGYNILVYGELWEEGYVDGLVIQRAKFSRDGRKVMDVSMDSEGILLNRPYTRTRYFNMGWAICSPEDKFNEEYGIELCKKRFRKSPLKTETGLFLTKDMVNALIENEVNYIKKNWRKFVSKNADPLPTVNEAIDSLKKNTEEDFDKWKAKKENEPTSYTEGPLTELEKLTRPVAKFENEEVCNESLNCGKDSATGASVQPEIATNSYVRVFNSSKPNSPFIVAYVKDVDDNGVNCFWLIKYGDNFSSFRVNNTYLKYEDCFIRPATKEEISKALKAIEEKTSFHWNVSEKRLEAKFA